MKNNFFGRHSVDSYSTLIRGSFLASFAKRFAAFAFVMLFAIPQMWGADPVKLVSVGMESAFNSTSTIFDDVTYKSSDETYSVTIKSYGIVGSSKGGKHDGVYDYFYSYGSAVDMSSSFNNLLSVKATNCKISKIIVRAHTNGTTSGIMPALAFVNQAPAVKSKQIGSKYGIEVDTIVSGVTIGGVSTKTFANASNYEYSFSESYGEVLFAKQFKQVVEKDGSSFISVPGSSQTQCIYGLEVYVIPNGKPKYAVNFYTDADKTQKYIDTQSVEEGSYATAPTTDPSQTGYDFGGWMVNGVVKTVSEYAINAATDFIAKWTAKTTTITLDKNGGSADGSATATYDGGISDYDAAKPASEGQTLLGYFDGDGNKIIDASGNLVAEKWTSTEPTMNLNAQWATSCTVRFMANGEVFDTQTIGLGGNATTPEGTPEAPTGKGFGGWSDEDGGAAVDVESITINGDKDFYAVWKDLRTVSFATGCGSAIDPVTVIDGQPVAKPTDPTRTNWEVTKWQLEGADYNFDSPVTSDIELTAVWQRKTISGTKKDITLVGSSVSSDKAPLTEVLYYNKSYTSGEFSLAGGMGGDVSSKTDGRYVGVTIPAGSTATFDVTIKKNSSSRTLSIVTEAERAIGDWSNSALDIATSGSGDKSGTSKSIGEGTYRIGSQSSGLTIVSIVAHVTSAPITATFKDGESTIAAVSATDGEELGNLFLDCELPVLANHDGMKFLGWYNGENKVFKTTTISASTTYTAKWQGEEHTLTWTIGEGTIKTPGTPAGQVEAGTPLTAPVVEREGYRFDGWSPEVPPVMPNDDAEYVAQWVKVYTVTYMNGTTTLGTETVDEGQKASEYTSYQNQPLATFQGWFDAATEGNAIIFATKTIDADLTAYGRWEKAYATTVDFVEAATGTKPDISTFLSGLNYAISSMDNVSWDAQPDAQADRGLKIEKSGTTLSFWVEADKRVKIKVGTLEGVDEGTAGVSVDGGVNFETIYGANPQGTGEPKEYPYITTEETQFVIKINNGCPGTGGVYQWNLIQTITIEDKPIVSDDVSLKDLTVNGVTIEGFAKNKTAYNVVLPYKTTSALVAAVANDENATVGEISQATSLPGIASFTVTAEDETTTADYTVNFTIAPKDGVEILGTTVTGATSHGDMTGAFKDGASATVSVTSGSYKMDKGKYITLTLPEGKNFAAGDVVAIDVKDIQDAEGFALFTSNDGSNLIIDTRKTTVTTGWNYVTLPNTYTGSQSICLLRLNNNETGNLNACVQGMKVYRAIMPTLTAISFNGVAGVIDDANKTVTATLPFTTDFSAIEVTESFISNDNSQVTKNYPETWIVGDNVISLTDKDGDYTEYTVTLSRAEASHDATLKSLKVGEDAITLVEDAYAYTYEYAYGALVPANVTAEPTSEVAKSVEITQATSETKLASILVTAEDETTQQEYTITFTEAAKPAETPTITTQPASHDYSDTEVIAALTVEAEVFDGGELSYQWYKDDVVIEGATAASYTPDQAGNYKVVVTNTLGEETADKESEVAVITIKHVFTFDSWDGESTTFTKTGEWTMYASNSSGVIAPTSAILSADPQTTACEGEGLSFYVTSTSRFVLLFEKDMTAVQLVGYRSSTTLRNLSAVKVSSTGTDGYADLGATITRTLSDETRGKCYVFDITNAHFEAGKYYFFSFDGTMPIYDIFSTPAEIEEESASLTAGKIDGIAMTNAQLAELNGDSHTLTLTKSAIFAPAVEFTYEHKITYKDGHEKTIVKTENGESAEVSDNFEISKTFETITYKVVCPIDRNPAMELSQETMDLSFSVSKASSKSAEVTLTGVNLTDGEYSFGTMPDGLSITPASFKIENKVVDQKFTVEFAATEPVAIATKQISFSDGTTSKILTVTYGAVTTYTLQDVSETMTWDFTNKAAADAQVNGENDGTYRVLANYAGVKGTFPGQYMAANFAKLTTGYIQAKGLKLHTTIPGMITVEFANTGGGDRAYRELYVNDNPTGAKSKTTEHVTYSQVVDAGDIVLTAYEEGVDWTQLNFYKIEFTAAEVLRDNLTVGKLGTYCPARNIKSVNGKLALWNAVLYQPNYFSEPFYINFIEAAEINAGYGYVLAPEATTAYAIFDGDPVGEAVEASEATRGMQGYLGEGQSDIEDSESNIILKNNHLYTASGNYLTNGKAYIRLDVVKTLEEINEEVVQGAPVRRRMTLGAEQANTPTNLDGIMMKQGVHKFIRNNQMYILREGRLYNAQGKMMR